MSRDRPSYKLVCGVFARTWNARICFMNTLHLILKKSLLLLYWNTVSNFSWLVSVPNFLHLFIEKWTTTVAPRHSKLTPKKCICWSNNLRFARRCFLIDQFITTIAALYILCECAACREYLLCAPCLWAIFNVLCVRACLSVPHSQCPRPPDYMCHWMCAIVYSVL